MIHPSQLLRCVRVKVQQLRPTSSRLLRLPPRHVALNVAADGQTLPASSAFIHTSSQRPRQWMSARDPDQEEKLKQVSQKHEEVFQQAVQQMKQRDKAVFQAAIKTYLEREGKYHRGHVEFIRVALDKMKEFNVHRDLETYKLLFELFPKGKMVPTNAWQVEMFHYPKQQHCAMEIMDYMTDNGIIPDDAMGDLLLKIFGPRVHVFRKYRRMMYWMPKFRNANPYALPYLLPDNRIELAKLAIKKMSVDRQNVITVYETSELERAIDQTYIVSGQSPDQRDILGVHPVDKPVFVEGPYNIWLREHLLKYYVMRSEQTKRYIQYQQHIKEEEEREKDPHNLFRWTIFEEESPRELTVAPSVHEQDDGAYLAMCITGTCSKESLASWIRFLERENPRLAEIPVIFTLRTPEMSLQVMEERTEKREDVIPKLSS